MHRMNLRDVPDDVYDVLSEAASKANQSLNAFVVDKLSDAARSERLSQYLATYRPVVGADISLEEATAAVREVREAT